MFRRDLCNTLTYLMKGTDETAVLSDFLTILAAARLPAAKPDYVPGPRACVSFSEAPITEIAASLADRRLSRINYFPLGLIFSRTALLRSGARPVIALPREEMALLPEALAHLHVTLEPDGPDFTWKREWRLTAEEGVAFHSAEVVVLLPRWSWADRLPPVPCPAGGDGPGSSWRCLAIETLVPFVAIHDLPGEATDARSAT